MSSSAFTILLVYMFSLLGEARVVPLYSSTWKANKKEPRKRLLYGSGGRIRTYDLWVMLTTSVFTARTSRFVVWTFSSPSAGYPLGFPVGRVPAIKSLH